MSQKRNRDKCKYVLHFKANGIDLIRIEDNNNQDILEYASLVFSGTCHLKVSTKSDLVVITKNQLGTVVRESLIMTVVSDFLSIEEDDLLCRCSDMRLRTSDNRQHIDRIVFSPLTMDEIEKVFNDSVVPFYRISTIDKCSQQLGIHKSKGIFRQ